MMRPGSDHDAQTTAPAGVFTPPAPSEQPWGPFTFYMGSHQPHWLATTEVPLFVSHRRLAARRSFPARPPPGLSIRVRSPNWSCSEAGAPRRRPTTPPSGATITPSASWIGRPRWTGHASLTWSIAPACPSTPTSTRRWRISFSYSSCGTTRNPRRRTCLCCRAGSPPIICTAGISTVRPVWTWPTTPWSASGRSVGASTPAKSARCWAPSSNGIHSCPSMHSA